MQRDVCRESSRYVDLPEGDEDALRTVTLASGGLAGPVVTRRCRWLRSVSSRYGVVTRLTPGHRVCSTMRDR